MEPLFSDLKYKSNQEVIEDCGVLQMETECFFSKPVNRTLENAFFHFGLLFDSSHYQKNELWKTIYKPVKELFKGVIDSETIVSAQLGKDLNHEYNEKEADEFDRYYWRIIKAKEYKRPSWALYMFVGNVQGLFNGNRITEKRLLQYLELLPEEFIQAEKERLQHTFNSFDERGYLLSFKNVPKLIKVGKGLFDGFIS